MQTENKKLIAELLQKLNEATEAVSEFKQLSIEELNYRTSNDSWSILECIEHLNLYGDFYLPEIEKQISNNKTTATVFKSGVIGNYFANLMQSKNGSIKKMKTFKDKNPIHAALTVATLDKFLLQLNKLKELLQQSANINLTKTKTAISISSFIKLRLGDTFRFVIYHIERHIIQAESVVQHQPVNTVL
jgi:hypothetical protein